MDERLRLLLFSFYSLGVNDTDFRNGTVTPTALIQANFDTLLLQHDWAGVSLVRD